MNKFALKNMKKTEITFPPTNILVASLFEKKYLVNFG